VCVARQSNCTVIFLMALCIYKRCVCLALRGGGGIHINGCSPTMVTSLELIVMDSCPNNIAFMHIAIDTEFVVDTELRNMHVVSCAIIIERSL
jgi:hypothetical protein